MMINLSAMTTMLRAVHGLPRPLPSLYRPVLLPHEAGPSRSVRRRVPHARSNSTSPSLDAGEQAIFNKLSSRFQHSDLRVQDVSGQL